MAIVAVFFFLTIFESCNNKRFELKAKVHSWQIGAEGLLATLVALHITPVSKSVSDSVGHSFGLA